MANLVLDIIVVKIMWLVDKIDKEEKADVHKKCAHERRIVVRKRCEGRLE